MTLADFTLPTDSAVTVSDMGDGQIILSRLNEGTGKTERVTISIAELQALTCSATITESGRRQL